MTLLYNDCVCVCGVVRNSCVVYMYTCTAFLVSTIDEEVKGCGIAIRTSCVVCASPVTCTTSYSHPTACTPHPQTKGKHKRSRDYVAHNLLYTIVHIQYMPNTYIRYSNTYNCYSTKARLTCSWVASITLPSPVPPLSAPHQHNPGISTSPRIVTDTPIAVMVWLWLTGRWHGRDDAATRSVPHTRSAATRAHGWDR
jgi:hypothetical protein